MASTVLVVSFMLATAVVDLEFHLRLSAEDSFVEWLTVAGLLAGSAVLLSRWWGFRQNQSRAWGAIKVFGALALVFGAGEEISWGQRLFDWGHDLDLSANRQNETNLHNLEIGGLNMNRVVFTYGLGAVIAAYYFVLPIVTRRRAGLRQYLTRLGIPVGSYAVAAWFVLCLVVVLLIPDTHKWETLEVVVPMSALVILLMRGVVGRGLNDCGPGARPSPAAR